MICQEVRLMVVVFLTLTQIHCGSGQAQNTRQVDVSYSAPGSSISVQSQSAPDDDDISRLVNLLTSKRKHIRVQSQEDLFSLANASPQSRQAVIENLTLSAQARHLRDRSTLDIESFQFWSGTCRIFGRLKAVEGINLLIGCINCSSGVSNIPEGYIPAMDALIEIGAIAIPKLSEALLHDDNRLTRGRVALTLGDIGGTEAQRALELAKQSETDKDVVHSIDIALVTIAGESKK